VDLSSSWEPFSVRRVIPAPCFGHPTGRGLDREGERDQGSCFRQGFGKWLKCTPDGGSQFVSDKAQASEIDPSQLEAYIRDYELEYLRNSLVTEPVAPAADS
jgi:hypothetical protein